MSLTNGNADPPLPTERPQTVAAFLVFLEAQKGYSPATLAAYAADLEQFAAFLAGRGL
ncbi:MAG: site-specific integrase, partial [Acidobacteriota bacterium]